uniref:Uncharacterized protein n=1 Tax=Anguilla anguilla TaxID=7936 RepID=A0A0E9XJ98_ANGAN
MVICAISVDFLVTECGFVRHLYFCTVKKDRPCLESAFPRMYLDFIFFNFLVNRVQMVFLLFSVII